ncbi:chromate transporter [Oceanobacillus longus]|uniref:Chromate transporter n=1 Tax=Oceanobacillus longus TaxID=930120 RepID=A0ABV8GZ93_9BACI
MIYIQLFWTFFIIGCFSFGGGYAMLPLIGKEVIDEGWLTSLQVNEAFALTGMLPGSIAINSASLIGYQKVGLLGVILTTFGIVLPSLIILILIAKHYKRFQELRYVSDAINGIKPVVVSLIFYSAIKFAINMNIFTTEISWNNLFFLLLLCVSFILMQTERIHPIVVIFISAIGGIIVF